VKKGQQLLLSFYEQLVIDFEHLPPPCRKELARYEDSERFTRTSDWRGWPRKKPQTAQPHSAMRAAQ
jgi:hypothetical protein